MRTKKSITNIFFNFSNQFITLILSFFSRNIFIHTLGVEYLGINGLFSDVLGMLSLADLGFNTAMVYSFYKPIAENNQEKISALITFYRKIYNLIAIAISIIGLCLTPFIKYIVNTDKSISNLEIYYLFALTGVVISYLFVYKTSIITADQKNYIVTRITIVTNIIKTIIQIISLIIFKNFIMYLSINILFNLLNNIIASHKAVTMYPYIKNKRNLPKSEIKNIFINLKSVFLYKLSSLMLNATDNILISIIVGTIAVGYYSNYLMISNKLSQIISLFFTSVTASIGNIIVKEKASKRYEIFSVEQSISFIISGIVIPCFTILINDLIILWLGKDYSLGYVLAIVLALNLYLSCVLQPLWSYREATGLYQKTKWIMFICAIINIVLSIIFGLLFGLSGIILASFIARISTYVWYEPHILFKEYFESPPYTYFKDLIKNFITIIIITVFLFIISSKFTSISFTTLIIKGLICSTVSILMILVIYKNSDGIKYLKKKLIRKKNKL